MKTKTWNELTVTPPDGLVQVIDDKGKKAYAYPTIYPFDVGKQINGKWTSPITPCEPYWDGGWMVACEGINTGIGKIVGWKTIQK